MPSEPHEVIQESTTESTAAERRGLDISSAPEDVQALLNGVMNLEEEIERQRDAHATLLRQHGEALTECDGLRAALRDLTTAVSIACGSRLTERDVVLADKAQAASGALDDERPAFNDLRGQTVRQVHRDDVVVITGAEWMRMRRAELDKADDEFDWPADRRGEDE